jgi:hypothetical protein
VYDEMHARALVAERERDEARLDWPTSVRYFRQRAERAERERDAAIEHALHADREAKRQAALVGEIGDERDAAEDALQAEATRRGVAEGRADAAEARERELREALSDPVAVARSFHDHYERLAPDFAYETREASAVAWVDLPANNARLMVATASEVLAELRAALAAADPPAGEKRT